MAKEIQLKDENGEKLYPKTKRNIITAYNRGIVELTSNNVQIRLNEYNSIGTKLTKSVNSIVIGAGVTKVLVSAQISLRWNSAITDDSVLTVMKNTSNIVGTIGTKPTNHTPQFLSVTNVLVDVVEGDILTLWYGTTSSVAIKYDGQAFPRTYLTVEVVE